MKRRQILQWIAALPILLGFRAKLPTDDEVQNYKFNVSDGIWYPIAWANIRKGDFIRRLDSETVFRVIEAPDDKCFLVVPLTVQELFALCPEIEKRYERS